MKVRESHNSVGRGRCVAAVAGLLALSAAGAASADTMLSETNLVSGTESMTAAFTVTGPGTLTVELANIAWPQTLTSLNFLASTATQVIGSFGTGASAVETFTLTAGGTYYAHVTGTAGGVLDLGLYSLTVNFQPQGSTVPLPPSEWLLASGLLLCGLWVGFLGRKPAVAARLGALTEL